MDKVDAPLGGTRLNIPPAIRQRGSHFRRLLLVIEFPITVSI